MVRFPLDRKAGKTTSPLSASRRSSSMCSNGERRRRFGSGEINRIWFGSATYEVLASCDPAEVNHDIDRSYKQVPRAPDLTDVADRSLLPAGGVRNKTVASAERPTRKPMRTRRESAQSRLPREGQEAESPKAVLATGRVATNPSAWSLESVDGTRISLDMSPQADRVVGIAHKPRSATPTTARDSGFGRRTFSNAIATKERCGRACSEYSESVSVRV